MPSPACWVLQLIEHHCSKKIKADFSATLRRIAEHGCTLCCGSAHRPEGRGMTTPTDQRINAAAVRLLPSKGTTQLTVSELAQEANVARGTLYRNVGSVDELFDRIAAEFTTDLHRRVAATFAEIDDPAARLATGVRVWGRFAHENPHCGWF